MVFETIQYSHFSVLKLKEDQITPYIEPDILNFINKFNLEGKNVIDGGSNIGLLSLIFSDAVGESGKVYAFEIQPIISQIGHDNSALNNKTNIICINEALSDKSGDMVGFSFIDYEAENISSTGIRTESEVENKTIKTVALDDLNIDNVGLIKLDLEGNEPKALSGMWQTIDRCKPNLWVELSEGYLGKDKVQETIELIKSHGYSVKEGGHCDYFCEPQNQ